MTRIAFATFDGLPELNDDDRLAAEALGRRGVEVRPAVWTDARAPWSSFDLVVLRSCWDYHRRELAFRGWLGALEARGVPIWNPPALLRWNLEKTYLRDLAAAGVPTVPSEWVPRGAVLDLEEVLARRGWDEVVVKPTVSASAWSTWRASRRTAADAGARAAALLDRGGVVVQPFVAEVAELGEWSLIFFGGRFSHAVVKRPAAGDFRVQLEHGGSAVAAPPPPRLIEAAERVLARVAEPWLYARVDGVESGGQFLLMELEMIEPFLFLADAPHAADAFADAIVGVLNGGLLAGGGAEGGARFASVAAGVG